MTTHLENELPEPDAVEAARMWNDYRAAAGVDGSAHYEVDYFGDHPALCDALLAEVTGGDKRATASLENEYTAAGEALPQVDSHWIACDSSGTPRIILRTTDVQLLALDQVDASFAYAEGEDDRTLASWRREHERYWRRTEWNAGRTWGPDTTRQPGYRVVCERFEVVWPPAGSN